jgi:undecaprenyl-diphosphatase
MVNAFLYLMALLLALKVFDVAEVGPMILPGKAELTCSFPSGRVLLFIVAMGSTAFHVWDLWNEKKKAAVAASVACIVVMFFGIVAQMICGTNWFTDTLGGVLLGVTLLSLYSFFFYI